MNEIIEVLGNKILCGDCLQVLKLFPENCIDSIVTDPPYELSFMGKKWDSSGISYNINVWKECLRILKPGAHMLVFGGTRTYHRMTCAVEDAGFEIRDSIQWIYAQGFPKNHNISKAIDKIKGVKGKVVGKKDFSYPKSDNSIQQSSYGISGGKLAKGTTAERVKLDIMAPTSIKAQQWEGWGTALKPAHEPILLARKPISEKNIALNVLEHGTGGINIDKCRVDYQSEYDKSQATPQGKCTSKEIGVIGASPDVGRNIERIDFNRPEQKGRWPANVIFDEKAGKLLDQQSGVSKSKKSLMGKGFDDSNVYNTGDLNFKSERGFNDSGGASRFFYCPKASKKERNLGCEDLEKRQQNSSRKEGKPGGDNPRNRGVHKRANYHATVKPLKLLRYLVKLVTPPNGIVIDPFAGSGTTCIACKLEGFRFIGIDVENDYCEIARKRIKAYGVERRK